MDTSSATDPLLAAAQGEQAKDPRHVDGSIFTGLDPSVQAHPSYAVQCPSIRYARCRSGSTSSLHHSSCNLHSSCCVVSCVYIESRQVLRHTKSNATSRQHPPACNTRYRAAALCGGRSHHRDRCTEDRSTGAPYKHQPPHTTIHASCDTTFGRIGCTTHDPSAEPPPQSHAPPASRK